jgi:TolB protein
MVRAMRDFHISVRAYCLAAIVAALPTCTAVPASDGYAASESGSSSAIVCYSRFVSGYAAHLVLRDSETGRETDLANQAIDYPRHPTWSPDGRRIAFLSGMGDIFHGKTVCIMNRDGTGTKTLATEGKYTDIAWAPDGRHLAVTARSGLFSSYDSFIEILDPDLDQPVARRITTSGKDYGPSWTPDGYHIVFGSKRDGNSEIYIMGADGSGATNLTNCPDSDDSQDVSSKGVIAFASSRGLDSTGASNVFAMKMDGSSLLQLTSQGYVESTNLRWSPDGSLIAFSQGPPFSGFSQIVVVDYPRGKSIEVTRDYSLGNRNDRPAWSADGRRIAFMSSEWSRMTDIGQEEDPERCDVYSVRWDGRQLTNMSAGKSCGDPAWSPRIQE